MQFTVEEEEIKELPFLYTLFHRGDDGLRFSVYRNLLIKANKLLPQYKTKSADPQSTEDLRSWKAWGWGCLRNWFTHEALISQRLPANLGKKANILKRSDFAPTSKFLILPPTNISEGISIHLGSTVKIAGTVKIRITIPERKQATNNPGSDAYRNPAADAIKHILMKRTPGLVNVELHPHGGACGWSWIWREKEGGRNNPRRIEQPEKEYYGSCIHCKKCKHLIGQLQIVQGRGSNYTGNE